MSEAEGEVDEVTSKAQLVRTINKFLLQNGLPVTAAALRKECEKLWDDTTPPKTTRKTVKKRKDEEGEDGEAEGGGGGGGERQILTEWMRRIGKGRQAEQAATTTATEMPPNPAKSTDGLPQQLLLSARRPSPSQPPPRRSERAVQQQQQQKDTMVAKQRSIDHQHHHHLRHHLHPSARSRSLLPNHPKHSRGTANMDTEGESAAEGKGNRTGEAARNMSASPPADPVRARPEPGRKDPKEMNTKEGKEPGKKGEEQGQEGQGGQGQGQWLCTHLDYGTIGQTLLKGAGPGREQTLLVQALRQQLTRAGSLAGGAANLRAMAAKDVLQLGNRKQSVLSLLLAASSASASSHPPDHPPPPLLLHSSSSASLLSASASALADLKDQLARLLNAIASFRRGRDYLLSVGQGRQTLYETALALRTKRVSGAAAEHLLAALQKLSIRPFARKELVINGMLEWLSRWLVQPRLSPGALEFGTALLHNLCMSSMSHQTVLRHKDDLLGTVQLLIGQAKNAQVLQYACGTLFALLALPRVRAGARERGDTERTLHERMRGTGEQQRQQLAALLQILRGDLDLGTDGTKKRQPVGGTEGLGKGEEDEEEAFPDYLEADIDSTDTLVPSLNELFGQQLLLQRFLLADAGTPPIRRPVHVVQFSPIEDDRESIPGVVPVPRARPRPDPVHPLKQLRSPQRKPRTARSGTVPKGKENDGGGMDMANRPPPVHFERSNSMSSHATFVVDNNGRRPLLATSGFASVMALMKGATGGHWQRLQQQRKRMGEQVAQQQKADREHSSSSETLVISEERNKPKMVDKVRGVQAVQKQHQQKQQQNAKSAPAGRAKLFSSKLAGRSAEREKWPRRDREGIRRSATTVEEQHSRKDEEQRTPSYDDYMNVFGARPKVVRTPPTDPLLASREMNDDEEQMEK